MKKLLFGIISLSMLTFAAQPTLTNDPTENTNVFQTGQKGEIAIKGNLSSAVPELKYVVYASTDGSYDATSGEVLNLPLFTAEYFTSGSGTSNLGFGSQPVPKLYVKKVNGSNNDVIDLTTETVLYKLNIDPAFNFTATNVIRDFTNVVGNEFSTTIFTLMSKDIVDEMVSLAGAGIKIIQVQAAQKAEIKIGTATDNYWLGGTYIMFSSPKMGELKIAHTTPSLAGPKLDRAACIRMMNYLATERTGYSDLSFEIKVQG